MEKRSSNFELLRIISMLMIVSHHFAIYSGWNFENKFGLRKLFIDYLGMFGKLGVVLFVLISAYYLCEKTFEWRRLKSTYLPTIMYTLSFFLIFSIFIIGKDYPNVADHLVLGDYLRSFLPITMKTYWFVTAYVFMIVISPFLNRLLSSLTDGELRKLLLLLTLFFSIMPLAIGMTHSSSSVDAMLFFPYLYLVSSYMKRKETTLVSTNHYFFVFLIGLILLMISILVINKLNPELGVPFSVYLLADMNSPIILTMAVALFLWVKNSPLPANKAINKIAGTTFGIYLIHENFFVRSFLWLNLVKGNTFFLSNYLVPKAFIACGVVFLACMSIEYIRQILVKKLLKYVHIVTTL